MEYEMRRRKFLVFLFCFIFYGKKKKIKMRKNDKRNSKKKSMGWKILEEKQAKGTFNLMVQELRLEDNENHFWWVQEISL